MSLKWGNYKGSRRVKGGKRKSVGEKVETEREREKKREMKMGQKEGDT